MKQILLFVLAWLALVSSVRAQTVEYIHTDALGTPVAVTNSSGVVIERSEYEPYGKLLNRPLTDGPGFTGHVQDAATGLTYMQQRYYDPGIGKMLSVDPVTAYSSGDWRHFNVYAYANNNPYRFTDPDGRDFKDIVNGFVDGMASNFLATPSLIQKQPIDLAPQPNGGVVGNAGNADYGKGRTVANVVTTAIEVAAGGLAGSGRAVAGEAKSTVPVITKPYSRPSGTPTAAQRASVQGKPCVDCGATTGRQVADHKTPMVKEYYETGGVNIERAKSLDAVQPQCATCSARQGAEMSRYSKEMKKEKGL